MRKKDFIYFASAAVLLAASVQVAHADEVGVKESAVTESEAVTTQASPTPVIEDKPQVAANNYAAPAPVTELPVTSSEVTKADEPKVETKPISAGQSAPSSESTAKPVTGTTTFYSAGSKAPSGRTVNSPVSADLSISNPDTNGNFTITAKNLKGFEGYKEVKIPFWSHANGMKDIVWYSPSRQADGSYTVIAKVSNHENASGKYEAQVFYVDHQGRNTFVKKAFIDRTKPSADLSISNPDANGNFTITAKNLKGFEGYKEVKIPFWSHANGMKDIVWYSPTRQSDGSYSVTAKVGDHENASGKYEAQLFYVDQQGRNTFVKKAFVDRAKPSADITISKNEVEGTFTITAKNLKGFEGYKEVKIPFWSQANGMKDVVWYSPSHQTDGSYTVTAKAGDHENANGQYEAQLFYVDHKGQNTFVKKTFVQYEGKTSPTGTITIQNNNKDNGTFDVIISNVYSPKGVRAVQVPTWSDVNGQDDLRWYEATRQSDGTYKLSVKASDHKFSTGTYHVHLYYIQGDDSRVGVGGTTVQVENKSFVTRNQLYLKHISAREADGQLGRVLKAASSLIGVETGTAEHLKLVKDYNSVYPLPVGYPVKNTDDWCDVFVTTVFQREGLSHLIGRECGVERHIRIFKHLGIWNEDGASTPKSGDIITFNWDQDYQQNDGWADHIGIVEYVENGLIHTIEGNSGEAGTVKRNVYRIGHGNIRGFATPRYK